MVFYDYVGASHFQEKVMQQQAAQSIGDYPFFASFLRSLKRIDWEGQRYAPAVHDDESDIQVRFRLVSESAVVPHSVPRWHELDENLVAVCRRVDASTFGGRIRSFEAKHGFIHVDIQLLKVSCEGAPGDGPLEIAKQPLWLIISGTRLGRLPPVAAMHVTKP